ncbi:MAG: hypothetical protein QW273_01425 [Candidatus Pacearchaeota archaeon]
MENKQKLIVALLILAILLSVISIVINLSFAEIPKFKFISKQTGDSAAGISLTISPPEGGSYGTR